jgi:hypothetical protein
MTIHSDFFKIVKEGCVGDLTDTLPIRPGVVFILLLYWSMLEHAPDPYAAHSATCWTPRVEQAFPRPRSGRDQAHRAPCSRLGDCSGEALAPWNVAPHVLICVHNLSHSCLECALLFAGAIGVQFKENHNARRTPSYPSHRLARGRRWDGYGRWKLREECSRATLDADVVALFN